MFDIILQGPIYKETFDVVEILFQTTFINNIIISTWDNNLTSIDGCQMVYSKDVMNPGVGNRNRMITSSKEGLLKATTDFSIKARTDQIISLNSWELMYNFYQQHKDKKELFVLGLYYTFPLHPRDHLFFGSTENLIKLFSVPHCKYQGIDDYNKIHRSEQHLGAWYAYGCVWNRFLQNPELYLTDNAPLKNEAWEMDKIMKNKIGVFPRIEINWPKHNLSTYHYDYCQSIGEYWNE